MDFNWLKIAWRSFKKSKVYTSVNIFGLAVGIAAVILIFIYIQSETSYDEIHPNAGSLFGIGEKYTTEEGETEIIPGIPSGWSKLIDEQLPGVNESSRITAFGYPHSLRNPKSNKAILTQDGEIFLVDKTFPDMLYFELVNGDTKTLLSNPNSIVLSEKAANRLFGSTDIVGADLQVKNIFISKEYSNLEVTGVFKDYPGNSHIRPDYLMPIKFLESSPYFKDAVGISGKEFLSGIDDFQVTTYVRLDDNVDVGTVESGLKTMVQEILGDNADAHQPFFRNIKDFHFDKEVDWSGWNNAANFNYILLLGFVGFMILIVACINYTNLTTAKSVKRAKEVGLKKSIGCTRRSLIFQFFKESFLTSFIALVMALIIVIAVLPTFNLLSDKDFSLSIFANFDILIGLLTIWYIVGLISGIYPALFLSSFNPIEVLNNRLVVGKGATFLRKGLVTAQLSVSVLLIICTMLLHKQMKMLQNTKLYEEADQIVSIRYGGGIAPIDRYATLKREILNDPDIQDVTMSIHLPRRWGTREDSFSFPEMNAEQTFDWSLLPGDFDLPEVFDFEVISGRSFKKGNTADSTNYLLNEAAIKVLNKTPDEVLGLILFNTSTKQNGTIIGVVKDFAIESIHTGIKPMVITGKPHEEDQILYVKLPSNMLQEKLASIEQTWEKVLPGVAFDSWFLSEEFGRMYYGEKKMSNLIKRFSILAIFIACLGLYGMASYTAEQKTKEIGIRKVLGANILQIIRLLFADYLRMIVIASLIAFPIGYFVMNNWLENFVYRIEITWFSFIVALLFVILLTAAVVAYESVKASIVEPAKSLNHD